LHRFFTALSDVVVQVLSVVPIVEQGASTGPSEQVVAVGIEVTHRGDPTTQETVPEELPFVVGVHVGVTLISRHVLYSSKLVAVGQSRVESCTHIGVPDEHVKEDSTVPENSCIIPVVKSCT